MMGCEPEWSNPQICMIVPYNNNIWEMDQIFRIPYTSLADYFIDLSGSS